MTGAPAVDAGQAGRTADPERPALGEAPGAIDASDDLATAGRKAIWPQLERLLDREGGLADPDQADGLRKYRVATRRLRAAARLFEDAYPRAEIRPIRRGLRDLARAVGAVRDLDVRIADLDRWAAADAGAADPAANLANVAPLREAWATERAAAHARLVARVRGRRHRRLIEALIAFADLAAPRGEPPPGAVGARTLGNSIASRTWRAYEDVRAFAGVVRTADVETLHDLRVATKRLRDGLSILGDVLGDGRAELEAPLVALQDHLGALNDTVVTVGAVRAFLDDRGNGVSPEASRAVASYLADRERQVGSLQSSVDAPFRAVAGLPFARRLGKLVVVPVPVSEDPAAG